MNNPCETCGYAEGSPACLQYCPYDAERKKEQKSYNDILTSTKQIAIQVTEDIDNFIFTTIKPWCEEKVQQKISKCDLEQALTQYFSKNPCDKCAMKNSNSNYCKNCTVVEYHGEKVGVPTKFVEQQPPVMQKSGKWLITHLSNIAYCSECDYLFKDIPANIVEHFKYCPNCGKRIVEPQESEE